MNVKELICQLAKEDDMDSTVYVRVDGTDGEELFFAVDGIATYPNSFSPTSTKTCTTLTLDV